MMKFIELNDMHFLGATDKQILVNISSIEKIKANFDDADAWIRIQYKSGLKEILEYGNKDILKKDFNRITNEIFKAESVNY